MSKGLKNAYTKIFWGVFKKFKLTPAEGLLLFLIHVLSKRTNWCYASKETLAEAINVSPQTIYNLLRKLDKEQLIERGRKSKYQTLQLCPSSKFYEFLKEIQTEITGF